MQNDDKNMFWSVFTELCAMKKVAPSRAIRDMSLSPSVYGRWKGGAVPYDTTIRKIAEHFGLEYEMLLNVINGFNTEDSVMREWHYKHWKEFLKQAVQRSEMTDEEKKEIDEREKTSDEISHRSNIRDTIREGQKYGKFDNVFELKTKKVPLLGEIACGQPIYADEVHGEFYTTTNALNADFCLQARGDSMINARIFDGDIVFCKYQPTVENGEIAAVIIDDEATLKRFYFDKDKRQITLVPENPAYQPLVFIGPDVANVRVIGKAIAFQSQALK